MADGKNFNLTAVFRCTDKISPVFKETRKNLKAVDRSFKNVTKTAGNFLSKLAAPLAIGGISGAFGLKSAVDEFVKVGDAIDKASARAGVATGALQKLRFAAGLGGMQAEQMDAALARLSLNMSKAASGGNKELAAMFSKLGIRLKDANGKVRDSAEVMRELAEAVKVNPDAAKRLQMLTAAVGAENAKALIPVLQDGAEGLDKAAAEAERLGIIMSEDDVKAAAALGDKISIFQQVFKSLGVSVAAKLAPALKEIIGYLQEAIIANKQIIAAKLNEFVEQLAASIKQVDFKALIDGSVKTVSAISSVIDFLGGFKTIITAVAAVMAGKFIVSAFATVSAIGKLAVAFYGLVGIPGLIVTAVAGVAYAIYKNWDSISAWTKELAETIGGALSRAAERVKEVWQGVKDFFASIFEWIGENVSKVLNFIPNLFKGMKGVGADADGFSGGANIGALNRAAGAPLGNNAGRLDGTVTVRVEAADGAKARVESLDSRGQGTVNAETVGAYNFGV